MTILLSEYLLLNIAVEMWGNVAIRPWPSKSSLRILICYCKCFFFSRVNFIYKSFGGAIISVVGPVNCFSVFQPPFTSVFFLHFSTQLGCHGFVLLCRFRKTFVSQLPKDDLLAAPSSQRQGLVMSWSDDWEGIGHVNCLSRKDFVVPLAVKFLIKRRR